MAVKETYKTEGKKRLIHAGDDPNGVAVVYLDENHVVMADPEGKSSVSVNKKFGVGIAGPLSIQGTPDQIRFAALWKLNPLLLTALPSTVYTPIPWLRPAVPQVPKDLVKGIVSMCKLLTAIS